MRIIPRTPNMIAVKKVVQAYYIFINLNYFTDNMQQHLGHLTTTKPSIPATILRTPKPIIM